MKTLRITLTLASALASTLVFAGLPAKSTPPPAGSAAYRSGAASSDSKMFEKSGKRTSSVDCTNDTDNCKTHCGN